MNSNALGSYLRSLRKAHGYTQEFVASKLNIIHQTYSHYETGRISPPADSLYLLAKLYDIPIDRLLELTIPHLYSEESSSHSACEPADELSVFLAYISDPKNSIKFRNLSHQEKLMLYYFQKLTHENRNKVIEQIKIEVKFQKSAKK
ncbi:MAG: helix-turn-helix transcriptional regulator [Lachnospiraceae bacterium]|nr:helix-turn-helix transcriptional regulator [Lachnospiraceae bacterium]